MILLVNSLRVSAEAAALALVAMWAVLTLVVPVLVAAGAQLAYPPPSRFAEIVAARAAEQSATTAYENDHPDLASEGFESRLASMRKSREIGRTIDRATAPLADRFAEQLAAQQGVVRTLTFISPPLVAGDALAAVAGTGSGASLAFRRATSAYLTRFKAALAGSIDVGTPLTLPQYDALPRFEFTAPPARTGAVTVFLGILVLALGGAAMLRFRSIKVD